MGLVHENEDWAATLLNSTVASLAETLPQTTGALLDTMRKPQMARLMTCVVPVGQSSEKQQVVSKPDRVKMAGEAHWQENGQRFRGVPLKVTPDASGCSAPIGCFPHAAERESRV